MTRIPVARPLLPTWQAIAPYLKRVDETRVYSNFGPLARQLEERLADRLGIDPEGVVSVANATVGLAAALGETRRLDRDLCLLPSWTFCASAHAVLQGGLRPFFVDVDPWTWQLSPDAVVNLPDEVLGQAAAIMPVGAFGGLVEPSAWAGFVERTGIPVVIDAAAGFDSLVAGPTPAVVSLHATKALPAGEGGFIATSDPELGRAIRQRINFGFAGSRSALVAATNGKLSEYAAAVALASLDEWPVSRGKWKQLRKIYSDHLSDARPLWFGQRGVMQDWVTATFVAALPAPSTEISANLSTKGIDTRRWWEGGCHREPAFCDYAAAELPVTDRLAASVLGLPFFPDLSERQVDAVVAEIVKYVLPDDECRAFSVYPVGDRR